MQVRYQAALRPDLLRKLLPTAGLRILPLKLVEHRSQFALDRGHVAAARGAIENVSHVGSDRNEFGVLGSQPRQNIVTQVGRELDEFVSVLGSGDAGVMIFNLVSSVTTIV